eukprot:TRINITY_DN8919_c0_g1_i3.p3 TRINITY_DN8919_c0_g1~~TRINITY_DN8919_c0_g1_i3.p3  ORF type:complete len:105 (-),score=6.97 TRINITY_DN8919_c0_g1_i3:108-422(-)
MCIRDSIISTYEKEHVVKRYKAGVKFSKDSVNILSTSESHHTVVYDIGTVFCDCRVIEEGKVQAVWTHTCSGHTRRSPNTRKCPHHRILRQDSEVVGMRVDIKA